MISRERYTERRAATVEEIDKASGREPPKYSTQGNADQLLSMIQTDWRIHGIFEMHWRGATMQEALTALALGLIEENERLRQQFGIEFSIVEPIMGPDGKYHRYVGPQKGDR